MYLANPWGLLGLLSLPIITAIHLFQRRFPPLLVAGAHLWGAETRVQTAGRRRDRLPVSSSLILELLAGLLFSFALAQPRFGELGSVAHLVVVLDDSASMSSRPAGESSFREQATAVLRERIEAAGRDARITLIRSGLQPTLLGKQAMTWEEAQRPLGDWQPRSPQHDFGPAWDEAARIVGSDGRFLFVTDRIPQDSPTLPLGINVASVGRKLQNVAISTARWTFDSESAEGRLFVRVSNYGQQAIAATLTITAGIQTILTQPVRLPPESEIPLESALPGGIGMLRLDVVASQDGLDVDNHVTLVEPKSRLLSVAVGLPEESPARTPTQRVLDAVPDVQPAPVETAHLLIGPADRPPVDRRGLWWFGIGPINPSPVIKRQANDLLGPYLIEKQHPLLSDVVLGGVVWGGVQPTDLPLRPLISAGRTPLLGQLTEAATTSYMMNIDFARSNLGESPDWPILMTNLLERRRDALPGLRRWNYQLGETVSFRAPPRGRSESADPDVDDVDNMLLLIHESGVERRLVRDRNDLVEISRLYQSGVYEVKDGDATIGTFAVNFFDRAESASLGTRAPGRRNAADSAAAMRTSIDDPYSWLMVLAILLLFGAILGDWFVLRPRGQSQ